MTRNVFGSALALAFAAAVVVGAQDPNPPQQPPAGQRMQSEQMVTVVGCLQHEKDVPGREPTVAERAGIAEDYLLTNAEIKSGGKAGATGTSGTEPAAGAVAAKKTFKIVGMDAERLKTFVGKRVEVQGRIEDTAPRPRGTTGTPPTTTPPTPPERTEPAQKQAGDLPQVRATNIREVAGTCPSK
jgi:hypothetical protein